MILTSIAANQNGSFVIAWNDLRTGNDDIYTQIYTNDGNPLGSNLRVNDDERKTSQNYPSIVMDENGNFVIVWEDKRNGNHDIYLQRFEKSGNLLGGNCKINDDQGGAKQTKPEISMDRDGKFVVTWEDYRNGYGDIYGQRFTKDGARVGCNFRATTSGNKSQLSPDVVLMNSNIINTWHDNRTEGTGYDIWANSLAWNDPYNEAHQLPTLPTIAVLMQNTPNPFLTSTTIIYSTTKSGFICLKIYDLLGKEVAILVDEYQAPENYTIDFNANDMSSGIYFIKLQGDGFIKSKKMLLLR